MDRPHVPLAHSVGFDLLELEARLFLSAGFLNAGDAPGRANLVATADFDGDGDLDVATTFGDTSPIGLNILRNNGNGVLSGFWEFTYSSVSLPLNVATADFDHDGDQDIVALGFRLFRNDAGNFMTEHLLSGANTPGEYFVVDEDGDDLPDIIVQDADSGEVILYRNVGGMDLAAGIPLPHAPGSTLRAVTDMDADGDVDLVYAHTELVVYRGESGRYVAGEPYAAGFTTPPVVADLDNDGLPDLVWAAGQIRTALNDGTGSFASAVISGPNFWQSIEAVGDFDGDGRADVAGQRSSVINGDNFSSAAFARDAGVFRAIASDFDGHARDYTTPLLFAADMTGDARMDILRVARPRFGPAAGFLRVYRSVPAPTISAFDGPHGVFIPGRELAFNLTATPGGAGPVGNVDLYRDANDSGVHDIADIFVGQALRTAPGSDTWVFRSFPGSGMPVGSLRFFAVARDVSRYPSDPAQFDVTVWTRVSYPEGWRNDATINEYVPIVNPNPFPVEYRLVAHYETGERDQVIAEGVIPPSSRGGVTISEHANPSAALVRLNEAYAIELQSSDFLGAMFSHYDSFTGVSGVGAATGEAFTSADASRWYFAGASTADAAFLVLFNPYDRPVDVTIFFYAEDNSFVTIRRHVDPFRRSGVALRDPVLGLTPNTAYGILVVDGLILAALSSYSLSDGSGFTALGRSLAPSGNTDFPLIEFRDSVQNRLTLFNLNASSGDTVTVHFSYIGAGAPPVARSYVLDVLERRVIDLDELRPPRATGCTLWIEPTTVSAFVESVDGTRGDSLGASPAAIALTVWAFADGFLDRNTAGTVGFESLALFNPAMADTSVRVRFLFTDGTFADQVLDVAAGATRRIQLDQEHLILDHAQLTFYSIMVYADTPIVASMIHWDLFQGGGWASLGTPGGSPGPA